jgi:hypothetical protein
MVAVGGMLRRKNALYGQKRAIKCLSNQGSILVSSMAHIMNSPQPDVPKE